MFKKMARCMIFFVAMLILQTSARLSPPRITKQSPPYEQLFRIAENDKNKKTNPLIIIECKAEANPAPMYKWYKNGQKLELPSADQRSTQKPGEGTLIISHPQDEDQGQYQCFAKNEFGTATSNSVLVQKASLNAFKDATPQLIQARENEPFMLSCDAPDAWPRPIISWVIQDLSKNTKPINNSRMSVDPEGKLWFSHVTKEDSLKDFFYVCSAFSEVLQEYQYGAPIQLQVISSAITNFVSSSLVQQFVSSKIESALRGENLELFCIYGGIPLPQIVWYKYDNRLQTSEKRSFQHFGKSVLLKNVSFEDEGTYFCDISNGRRLIRHAIDVNVLAAPYFTVQPEVQTVVEGNFVEIRCEAGGVPEPRIEWIHNGKPISATASRMKIYSNKISIQKVQKNDTANYGCKAINSMGYVYKDVYVNVVGM